MKRKEGGAAPKEFKDSKLAEYKADAIIVVPRNGNWVEARVMPGQDPVVQGDKLKLLVSFDTKNATNPETISVDEPPEIVAFTNSESFSDALGAVPGVFVIEDMTVIAKDGTISYDVRQPDNTIVKGVPQELLVAYKKALDLEEKVRAQETDLKSLPKMERRKLSERRDEIRDEIFKITSEIPDVQAMPNYEPGAIDLILSKVNGLHENAEKAVEQFERTLQQTLQTAEPDKKMSHADFNFFKHTREEIKDPLKHRANLRESIYDSIQRKEAEADAEYHAVLDEKIAEAMDEYDRKYAAYLAEKKVFDALPPPNPKDKNKPQPPKEPAKVNIAAIKLDDDQERQFKQKKAEAPDGAYGNAFEVLSNDTTNKYSQELVAQVVAERRRQAALDLAEQIPGRRVEKFNVGQPDEYFDYNDKLDDIHSTISKKTRDILKGILESDDVIKTPENAKVFNFDDQTDALLTEAERLLKMIPKETDGKTPKAGYEKAASDLVTTKGLVKELKGNLADLDKAQKHGRVGVGATQDQLNQARVEEVAGYQESLSKLENEIYKKLYKEKRAEVPKIKSVENRKDIDRTLDLPATVVENLLLLRRDKIKEAARLLLEDDKKAAEAVKNIFAKDEPDPDTLALLRQHGINDWDIFKKMWDEKLAEKASGVLKHALDGNLNSRLAKEISTTEKIKAVKGQIAFRAISTAALVGVTAVKVSALAAAVVGTGGLAGAAALAGTVAGGAAGGAVRGWLNRKIFESNFMKDRTARLMHELEEKKRHQLFDKILEEWFADSANELEGVPMMAAIISEQIEKHTGVAQKTHDEGPMLVSLEAEQLYETALARMEVEPDNDTKRKLRLAIARIHENGGNIERVALGAAEPKVITILEDLLKNYAGKNGVGAAAVSGAVVATAFAADSTLTRAIMGAAIGATAGWRLGEHREKKMALETSAQHLRGRVDMVRTLNKQALEMSDTNYIFNHPDREEYQTNVLQLKRLLHGTGESSELAALCTISVDDHGERKIEINEGLIALIRTSVADAEKFGIFNEKGADRVKPKKVLETLNKTGDQLETAAHHDAPDLWKKFIKTAKKVGFASAGAAVGATTALIIGATFQGIRNLIFGHQIDEADLRQALSSNTALSDTEKLTVLQALKSEVTGTPTDLQAEQPTVGIKFAAETTGLKSESTGLKMNNSGASGGRSAEDFKPIKSVSANKPVETPETKITETKTVEKIKPSPAEVNKEVKTKVTNPSEEAPDQNNKTVENTVPGGEQFKEIMKDLQDLRGEVVRLNNPEMVRYLGQGQQVYKEILQKVDAAIDSLKANPYKHPWVKYDANWLIDNLEEDKTLLFAAPDQKIVAHGHALMYTDDSGPAYWYDSTKNFVQAGKNLTIENLDTSGRVLSAQTFAIKDIVFDPETQSLRVESE